MWQIKMIPFGSAGMAFVKAPLVSAPEWETTEKYVWSWCGYEYRRDYRVFFGMIGLGVFQEEACYVSKNGSIWRAWG